jgi:hypothetical protein
MWPEDSNASPDTLFEFRPPEAENSFIPLRARRSQPPGDGIIRDKCVSRKLHFIKNSPPAFRRRRRRFQG